MPMIVCLRLCNYDYANMTMQLQLCDNDYRKIPLLFQDKIFDYVTVTL